MTFTLEIELRGMLAYFPSADRPTTDVAIVQSENNQHHPHDAQLLLGAGTKTTKGKLPKTLLNHDVEIHVNEKPLLAGTGNPHSVNYLPMLTRLFSPDDVKAGVRIGLGRPIASVCSGRIQLVGGNIYADSPTRNEWHLVPKSGTQESVWKSVIAMSHRYAVDINSKSVELAIFSWKGGRRNQIDTVGIAPIHAGTARLTLTNYYRSSVAEKPVDPTKPVRSPHFDLVYGLINRDHKIIQDCYLQQVPIARVEGTDVRPLSVHLPCVGGCAC